MNRFPYSLPLLLTAGALTILTPFSAAARERISNVSLNFSLNQEDASELDVECTGEGYDLQKVTLFPNGDDKSPHPYAVVILDAGDEYYFSSIKSSYFTLEGEGASFSEAARTNSNSTMTLTVRLKDLGEGEVEEPTGLRWNEKGIAIWEPVSGAGNYSVRIRRNGNSVSSSSAPTTEITVYNFSTKITKTGDYTFQVRTNGKYKKTKSSDWVTSSVFQVDEEKLAYIREHAEPDSGLPGQWLEDEHGSWYAFTTGEVPVNTWKQIDGYWYYFNESGYIAKEQWIGNYYVGSSGKMLTNTTTPDGYYVDENGAWAPK